MDQVKAVDPGLVYKAGEADYVRFLCFHGYSTEKLKKMTKDNITREGAAKESSPHKLDLNYPSITLTTNSTTVSGFFWRTVTNVRPTNSMYNAPPSLQIDIDPRVLFFTRVGENKSFLVRVEEALENGTNNIPLLSGSITWTDGIHNVRSPVVIYGSRIRWC